jgi:hypothetical protein
MNPLLPFLPIFFVQFHQKRLDSVPFSIDLNVTQVDIVTKEWAINVTCCARARKRDYDTARLSVLSYSCVAVSKKKSGFPLYGFPNRVEFNKTTLNATLHDPLLQWKVRREDEQWNATEPINWTFTDNTISRDNMWMATECVEHIPLAKYTIEDTAVVEGRYKSLTSSLFVLAVFSFVAQLCLLNHF